ncbi:sterol desaturase family protein [Maricaulis sp.]|uniref:sterol desaturase family protein n=1 Tax=Maricaulis sp. TaxID=1486257 RepID=UPI00261EAACB|nr:sterol desaturase family protein [Maricaulis sp.]
MSPDAIESLGTQFDDAFFIIGAAILVIELLKGAFNRSLSGKSLLDMIASVSTQLPYLLIEIFLMVWVYIGFVLVSETWISWRFEFSWTLAIITLIVADFVYYWEHRFAHEVRLLWTQHAVHHSSRFMNILVSVRFGPLETVTSALFHFPMILIGFPAELVFASIIIVQAYQVWIHTELIGKLGPLDGVLNTPANHRVHHGCDEKYLDKNYGGILIIWDRLFGTYQREEETPRYGLARDFDSVNPLAVWFSELPRFFNDLGQAKSASARWRIMFGRPGASPDA